MLPVLSLLPVLPVSKWSVYTSTHTSSSLINHVYDYQYSQTWPESTTSNTVIWEREREREREEVGGTRERGGGGTRRVGPTPSFVSFASASYMSYAPMTPSTPPPTPI
jgi:hypothetical protein